MENERIRDRASSCDSVSMVLEFEAKLNFHRTQCARTDLNKRFLPKPMTTTG